MSSVESRWCPDCNEEKPLTDFSRDATGRDGYRYNCTPCRTARRAGVEWAVRPFKSTTLQRSLRYSGEMIDEHVENWRGYVQYKARLKARQMGRLDMAPDLYSQGLQAVWYAFQKWDPQRPAPGLADTRLPPPLYVQQAIQWRFNAFLKAKYRWRDPSVGASPLELHMDEDEDDYASYEAVDALDLDGEAEAAGALQGLLSMCSSTEEQYVRLRLQGLSYTEVATELGVSRQAVQQALKRLQRRYEEANG